MSTRSSSVVLPAAVVDVPVGAAATAGAAAGPGDEAELVSVALAGFLNRFSA